jgi:hypothetical protein
MVTGDPVADGCSVTFGVYVFWTGSKFRPHDETTDMSSTTPAYGNEAPMAGRARKDASAKAARVFLQRRPRAGFKKPMPISVVRYVRTEKNGRSKCRRLNGVLSPSRSPFHRGPL